MITTEAQTILKKKTLYLKPTFQISKNTKEQQKFLTMFNFQHSQITQKEFEQLAKLLMKNTQWFMPHLNLMLEK